MRQVIKRALPASAVRALKRWRSAYLRRQSRSIRPADYWTRHHVEIPGAGFRSVEESLAHYTWRNQVNPGQMELMPVDDARGKVVLDYGCGPGNDVIGFGHFSRPARLLACDVSPTALAIAGERARLHGFPVEFTQIHEAPVTLPYEDRSIDIIHSAGVLHHTPDPGAILAEFGRVLKPGGEIRIMVYHRDSIWLHLHTSYILMIEQGLLAGLTPDEAFHLTTDGESCPIANCYRAEEFLALGATAGLAGKFVGAGMTTQEFDALPKRWAAIADRRLAEESRQFLYDLRFDDRGWPHHHGRVAGVNAYFRFSLPE